VPDRIDTVHEAIPVDGVNVQRSREEILQQLGLPDNAVLVVASGILYWGKGADLFVQLARAVCRQRPNAYFAWIGYSSPEQVVQCKHDVRLAGLEGRVCLTGAVPRPADYFAAADVFVLPSREDSFPLACLEAAVLGKPIVCFADAGGAPEFVEDDCGFVVPYLDVAGMAERLIFLLDSLEYRLRMGAAARRKVKERHNVSIAGPRIAEIIERTITGG
jgi:glycosyltransferase involved in cell wall biosynthesis